MTIVTFFQTNTPLAVHGGTVEKFRPHCCVHLANELGERVTLHFDSPDFMKRLALDLAELAESLMGASPGQAQLALAQIDADTE